MTANEQGYVPVVCVNGYVKLEVLFGPARFSVGTCTETMSYKC